MIRRVTPNKTFSCSRTRSQCCGWLCGQQIREGKVEVSFSIGQKKAKQISQNKYFNTATTVCHRQDRSVAPQSSHHKSNRVLDVDSRPSSLKLSITSRTNLKIYNHSTADMVKTGIKTTTPGTMSTEIRDRHLDLPESVMPSTPLERIEERTLFKRQVQSPTRRLFGSEVKKSQLKKLKKNIAEYMEASVSRAVKIKIMGNEEEQLRSEIKKYKNQYKNLLGQFQALQQQKKSDMDYYQQLLSNIYERHSEIRQKEQNSRQQLEVIKKQIQKLGLSQRK